MKKFNVVQAKEIPGREKPIWLRIGKAFEKDDGKLRIKLEVLPLPNKEGDIWLSMFEDTGDRDGFTPSGMDSGPSYSSVKNGTSTLGGGNGEPDVEIPF